MNNIIELFNSLNTTKEFLSNTKEKKQFSYLVYETTINTNYLLTYTTFIQSGSFVVYVASNVYKANLAYEAFTRLAGIENVNLYVVDEFLSLEMAAINSEFKLERLNTLMSIINNQKKIIVTHTAALLKPLQSLEDFKKGITKLKVGNDIDLKGLSEKLIRMGYTRVPTTYSSGEFSLRGEVVDIFSYNYSYPIRINLFDTEIETIKHFNLSTQKTTESISQIDIYPLNEIYLENDLTDIESKILNDCDNIPSFVSNDINDLKNYNNLEKMSKYIKYFCKDYTNILEYLDDKIVIYDDYNSLKDSYTQLNVDLTNYLESITIPKKLDLFYFYDFDNITYNVNKKVFCSEFKNSLINIKLDKIYCFNSYLVPNYQSNIPALTTDIKANKNKTYVFAIETKEEINLFFEVLKEQKIESFIISNFSEIRKSKVNLILVENAISFGTYSEYEVLTDKELFPKATKKTKYRSVSQSTVAINSKDDLTVGDYVVHYDYGIGKYIGIKTINLNNTINDYIMLQYENMELFIPVEKIVLLEKYQGSEGSIPKLTKLGTNEWEKKKAAIKEKLETIAKDLITLQVARETKKGVIYPKDNQFQKMFEDDFEYTETPDQLKIISQVKEDMENGIVIDRLICGDVGFGKTEIAIRAAFKTIFGGKQVAYLAPTTILTRQHFYTFKNRLDKYGIKVALLNRLVTQKEQALAVKGLKDGTVDIIIGTHRLLSEDITFKDLGLLIVDEEQRFGVIHKEKIKRLKENVNVLTLTATPIPRTLQMSVMGIRQLSLLETPPEDRYPIQTYVLEYNDIIIKEAIYRELGRGGQIFYLHNTISDMEQVYRKLKKMVPEVKICMGHGQMNREDLEDTIQSFIDHEYDLLLCTTIIETGIDIPNTNTLIIDEADRLGLSQIYQIRGRVGRSDKIAYAYLTYKPNKVLTAQGSKRLSAIKEFTKLGSGYRIAVRDLAIRGAGDILGSEQSGFINSVGIDMYMKLLDEAINKAKGVTVKEKPNYQIEVSKHVDENYVSDDAIKILIHKEISNIDSKQKKESIINDFTDRFGKLNNEILTYIEEKYLESLLHSLNVKNVMEAKLLVSVIIPEEKSNNIDGQKLFIDAYKIDRNFNFEYRNRQIIIKLSKKLNDKSWIYSMTSLLETLIK